jgi:hypothetical protein
MGGLPARDTMEHRERAAVAHRDANRLAREIERLAAPGALLRLARLVASETGAVLDNTIQTDETIAQCMVDLRTHPSAAELRRRITARDTGQKRARRQAAIAAD